MLRSVIAALAALVFVAACGPAPVTTQPSESPTAFDPAGPWELESGTLADQPLVLDAGAPITLVVEGSQVSGRSACNQYFGEFAIVDGKVTLGGLGGTEMACEEPIMTLEAAYLSALAKVDSAQMDGAALVLAGPQAELRFERLEPPPTADMIGTHWLLESIVQADVASSPVGVRPTLLLNADGTLRGSTGCRTLTAGTSSTAPEIRPTNFAAEGACTDDVSAQDSQVIEILGDGFRAAMVGQKLQITSPGGVWGLVYAVSGE